MVDHCRLLRVNLGPWKRIELPILASEALPKSATQAALRPAFSCRLEAKNGGIRGLAIYS